jgi:hypothetical protein
MLAREELGRRAVVPTTGSVDMAHRLSGADRDDAADRIIRRYTDGHAITGDYFDSEAAHPAAQLREHLVPGVALHAVQPTGVDRDDGALHIYQIVLAQSADPFDEA